MATNNTFQNPVTPRVKEILSWYHSENPGVRMVVYRRADDISAEQWVRPYALFCEKFRPAQEMGVEVPGGYREISMSLSREHSACLVRTFWTKDGDFNVLDTMKLVGLCGDRSTVSVLSLGNDTFSPEMLRKAAREVEQWDSIYNPEKLPWDR